MTWEQTLRDRLNERHAPSGSQWVSIKIRACGGCYDRGCCPVAMRIVDEAISKFETANGHAEDFKYERHESGPEFLVCLAVASSVITLVANVIQLVTVVIQARSIGRKQGDRHDEPLELVVRGFDRNGKLFDDKVMLIREGETPTANEVKNAIDAALRRHLVPRDAASKRKPARKKSKRKA